MSLLNFLLRFLFTLLTLRNYYCLHRVKLYINKTHVHIITKKPQYGSPGDTTISDGGLDQYAECIENYKRAHPQMALRFNDLVLARTCRRFQLWVQHLSPVNQATEVFNLTKEQRDYIQTVQSCHSKTGCFGSRKFGNKTKRQSTHRVIRRECRTLNLEDLNQYFQAIRTLKETRINNRSRYDLLVFYHLPQTAPSAHFGPAFLPYHRELLKQLELAVRQVNPELALCYWDSTLDHDLPNPSHSVLWTPDIFGNGQGFVTTGPFANWPTEATIPDVSGNRLYRNVGAAGEAAALYNRGDIERFMQITGFERLAAYCQDPTFEILHGGVHDFVGGHMTYLASSPNDPVFFGHHCFIDYFWENWRHDRQTLQQRENDYPPDGARACGSQYYANAPMRPFALRNKDGLSNTYHTLYTYAPSPTCENGGCQGDFLFCNTDTGFCSSKIRPGGDCTNLEQFESCYNSVCQNGRCQPTEADPTRPRNRRIMTTRRANQFQETSSSDIDSETSPVDDINQ